MLSLLLFPFNAIEGLAAEDLHIDRFCLRDLCDLLVEKSVFAPVQGIGRVGMIRNTAIIRLAASL